MAIGGLDRLGLRTCAYVLAAAMSPLAPSLAAAAPPGLQPASVPLRPGADRLAEGMARMVGAILEYTRWPSRPAEPLTLCVVAPAIHAGRIGRFDLSGGRTVLRRDVPAGAAPDVTGCDALYLGQLELADLRRWTRAARGAPVLTIAEGDPPCGSEAMFCIRASATGLSFDLNIDAVSRSGVHVDPRVLRMASGED